MRRSSGSIFVLTLLFLVLESALASSSAEDEAGQRRCVVLLHGLARTSWSMRPLAQSLKEAGWFVVNRGYPSRSATIETLSREVGTGIAQCLVRVNSSSDVDLVTHSMGGMLVRQWAADHSPNKAPDIGRVVMLGPPNHGSELVDRLGRTPAFRFYNGPAGMQLGTGVDAHWRSLPDVNFELGVIAGTGEEQGFLGRHVAAPNDGKVSVASTRAPGMEDHIVLRVGHTFMMGDPGVHAQIIAFLTTGRFEQ